MCASAIPAAVGSAGSPRRAARETSRRPQVRTAGPAGGLDARPFSSSGQAFGRAGTSRTAARAIRRRAANRPRFCVGSEAPRPIDYGHKRRPRPTSGARALRGDTSMRSERSSTSATWRCCSSTFRWPCHGDERGAFACSRPTAPSRRRSHDRTYQGWPGYKMSTPGHFTWRCLEGLARAGAHFICDCIG